MATGICTKSLHASPLNSIRAIFPVMSGAQVTVSVLCPSGHTVDVKVSQNDPVHKVRKGTSHATVIIVRFLQILESACAKRRLDASGHRLRRAQSGGARASTLDDALSVRLANLGNRAKLEMVQLTEEEKAAKARLRSMHLNFILRVGDALYLLQSVWRQVDGGRAD